MGLHASCLSPQHLSPKAESAGRSRGLKSSDDHEQVAPSPKADGAGRDEDLNSSNDETLGHPHRGVSVAHLAGPLMERVRQLQQEQQLTINKPTVADIEPLIIRPKGADLMCPRDGKLGAAYVDSISDGGEARFMLSYTWRYAVEDIAETLVQIRASLGPIPTKTFVWMCCFCVNQHRVCQNRSEGRSVPFETFRQAFAEKVQHLDMVAMMSPWRDPFYLKRAWCVFEMYTACNLGRKIIIAMPRSARESFQSELLHDGGTDGLWSALRNINSESAEASVRQDKENIFDLIGSGPGFAKLNQTVARCLKTWAIGVAESFALERIELRDLEDVELGKLCSRVVGFMKKCGRQRYTLPLREAGKQAFERAGASETAEGWNMLILDTVCSMQSHDMKGMEQFLEKARHSVALWEEEGSTKPLDANAWDLVRHCKSQGDDECVKALVITNFYFHEAYKSLVEHGNTPATKATFAKFMLAMDAMGTQNGTLTAFTVLAAQYFDMFILSTLTDTEMLAQIDKLFDAVDDRNEKGELWSPDHASMLTMAARIKGMHGEVEAALTDAEAAYAIYEKLGGIEFRHEGNTGCDTCGELMLYLGVLKYQTGDSDSALKAFQCGLRISEELGNLETNMFRLSFGGAAEKDALAQLRAASD